MLQECIESITKLSLNARDREIILIDDGTDVSQINEMHHERDKIIYLRQRNQGLSAARNMGLRVASGKYVQFIDGDDMVLTAPYEHCLDIARYHEPDLVSFNATNHKNVATPMTFEGPMTGAKFMRDNNIKASACSYLFKKTILSDLRFAPGLLHEDEEFTPQLILRAERLFTTDADAYYYRKREGSIMTNNSQEHRQRRLSDTLRILLHLQELSATLPELDRLAMNRRIAQLSMDFLYNTIKLTHSRKQLLENIELLRKHGLYPLPDRNYTRKYSLFRRAIDSRLGRMLLLTVIK
jgi:glycosyltransferase involved in cell wall biosynthesis